MNISKHEQRVLHVLAQGGAIHFERAGNGKVTDVTCITRDGHILSDCTLAVFDRLKKRGFIRSVSGQPYSATKRGVMSVRAQLDNRCT
jgi:uncharacterized protein YjhX (UPF0386 family)